MLEFVKLNDTIAAITRRLGEARKEKADMVDGLLNYMRFHKIGEVHIDTLGGRVVAYDAKRTESLKRHHIENEILPLVGGDSAKCAEIVDRIYSSRVVAETPTLGRKAAPRSMTTGSGGATHRI